MQNSRIAGKALSYVFDLMGVEVGKTNRGLKDHGHLSQDTQKKI